MNDFNRGHATALITSMLDTDGPISDLFDNVSFNAFASQHAIPTQNHSGVRQALAQGYAGYLRESRICDLDAKAIGTSLKAVIKATDKLKTALADLPPDELQAMNGFVLGASMAKNLPTEEQLTATDPALVARALFENDATSRDYRFDIDETLEEIERLSLIANGALTFVGANKPGTCPDERFFALMSMARVAWEMVLGRDFKLDWTDGNQPITEAARFCFDVAKAADSDVEPKKIRQAARQASEETLLSQLLA